MGRKALGRAYYHTIHTCVGEEKIVNKGGLEIGSRCGMISSLFALLGAKVTGVDLNRECLLQSGKKAVKQGVSDRGKLLAYDGNLDTFPDASFDLIYENRYGNKLIHFLRKFRHTTWSVDTAKFFKRGDMQLLHKNFDVKEIKSAWFPPMWMIYGEKKTKAPGA